jgi:hypothetical protein
MKGLLALILPLVLLISCSKPDAEVWTVYHETSCKRDWSVRGNDAKTKENLRDYLNSKGIETYKIKIEGKEADAYCLSCDCETGRRMEVLVEASDLEAIKGEGFSEM